MKKKLLFFFLLISILYVPVLTVTAQDTFPHKLTNADLPEGFELVTTTNDTQNEIVQVWKTPSDTNGTTILTVIDYNTTDAAKFAIAGAKIFFGTPFTVSGADEAVNSSIMGIDTILARKKAYVASCSDISSDIEDVITLLEAQMKKIPGDGGVPGFTLFTTFIAISICVITFKKNRK